MKSRPRVAIITRTKDRNLLLRRALESVGRQTFDDWLMVIVNDGGDPHELEGVLSAQRDVPQGKCLVIHNPQSLGMEAASNRGLQACDSEFVVIHDDDDSWHPEFLEHTTTFLDDAVNARYAGVVTHSVKVSEVVENQTVTVKGRELFNAYLEKIDLQDMAGGNLFPPISFLYRRSVFGDVGYYREDLPVLGDWDFNLRFLLRYQIGVLPEPLAHYHHRELDRTSAFANSIIGGIDKHVLIDAYLRNDIMGRDVRSGASGLGQMIQIARGFGWMHAELRQVMERLDRVEHLHRSDAVAVLKHLAARSDLGDAAADVRAALAGLGPLVSRATPNPADTDQRFLAFADQVRGHVCRGEVTGTDTVAVFGASPFGERIVQMLAAEGIAVCCIFDNSPGKAGTQFAGVPVRLPHALIGVDVVVNASISHAEAIHRQLLLLGRGQPVRIISHGRAIEHVS